MQLPRGQNVAGTVMAVDIGATKMAVGVVDGGGGVRSSAQAATPKDGAQEEVWSALEHLLDSAFADVGDGDRPVACGVGCAGPMDRNGLVSPLNIPGWRRFPLRARLIDYTGLPTAVDNDAKALALAEGWVGERQDGRTIFRWSFPPGSEEGSCSTGGSLMAIPPMPDTSDT